MCSPSSSRLMNWRSLSFHRDGMKFPFRIVAFNKITPEKAGDAENFPSRKTGDQSDFIIHPLGRHEIKEAPLKKSSQGRRRRLRPHILFPVRRNRCPETSAHEMHGLAQQTPDRASVNMRLHPRPIKSVAVHT